MRFQEEPKALYYILSQCITPKRFIEDLTSFDVFSYYSYLLLRSNLLESNIRPTQSTPYPLKPTNHVSWLQTLLHVGSKLGIMLMDSTGEGGGLVHGLSDSGILNVMKTTILKHIP